MAEKKNKLSDKQMLFVQEYLIDLNATQAAIRAGYSENTAYSQGQRLLKNVEVQKAIDEAKQCRSKRTLITQDRVLEEIAKVAFGDIRSIYDDNGNLLHPHEWEDDTAAMISGMDVSTERDKDSNEMTVTTKVRLNDKLRALEMAGRHLKLFTDKTEHSGEIAINVKRRVISCPKKSS